MVELQARSPKAPPEFPPEPSPPPPPVPPPAFETPPQNLADLKKGLNVPHDSGNSPSVPPAWLTKEVYDPTKIRAFYERHHFALTLGWNVELVFGFAFKEILSCLVYTGQSGTPPAALKRYQDTFVHYSAWHRSDIFDPTSEAYASLQGVRSWHAVVEKDMERDKPGATWISSFAMAVVQCGSAGACTDDAIARHFGFGRATRQELADYVTFWRCVRVHPQNARLPPGFTAPHCFHRSSPMSSRSPHQRSLPPPGALATSSGSPIASILTAGGATSQPASAPRSRTGSSYQTTRTFPRNGRCASALVCRPLSAALPCSPAHAHPRHTPPSPLSHPSIRLRTANGASVHRRLQSALL
jgi:hypothetical protein